MTVTKYTSSRSGGLLLINLTGERVFMPVMGCQGYTASLGRLGMVGNFPESSCNESNINIKIHHLNLANLTMCQISSGHRKSWRAMIAISCNLDFSIFAKALTSPILPSIHTISSGKWFAAFLSLSLCPQYASCGLCFPSHPSSVCVLANNHAFSLFPIDV